jgi:GNAT superfamily N-acetyltransferase
MGILQRWFNLPSHLNAPFITDKLGNKFWIAWDEYETSSRLDICYRGKLVGYVNLLWDEKRKNWITLSDIFISNLRLRNRGLGKAMLQEAIAWAKKKGAICMWGVIQPEEEDTVDHLIHFYKKQGFVIENRGIFLPLNRESYDESKH